MGKKMYGHPQFYEIIEELKRLHSVKNHDYAGEADPLANLRECERINIPAFTGCFVRIQDKYMRLMNFIKSGTLLVKDESVRDTLRDMAVYSILAMILYDEQLKKQLSKSE